MVGASGDSGGGNNRGSVYTLFLNADLSLQSFQKIADGQGGLATPLVNLDRLGGSVAVPGDLDGDGIADLVTGAAQRNDGGPSRGACFVLFRNADGSVKSGQLISDTLGNFTGVLDDTDRFYDSLSLPGDLDGDGVPDLITGMRGDDDGGAVWTLFLNADGTVKSHNKISSTMGGFTGPLVDSDIFGPPAVIGDLDADGVTDLAVGAVGGTDRGAVWVLFMNPTGTVKARQKISAISGGLTGPLADSVRFGIAVAGPGDLDGDGLPDQAVGYALFKKYDCIACHQGTNVGGNMYQKFGVLGDYFANRREQRKGAQRRPELEKADLGRYNVTGREEDRHKFKVPSLRNVELTPPYFHDGSAQSLKEAVRIMGRYQLGVDLQERDIELIVMFLKIHTATDFLRDENTGVCKSGDAQFDRALEDYEIFFGTRKKSIDRFKSGNSILKNSLYYFPQSVRRVNRIAGGGTNEILNDLSQDI